MQGKGLDSQAVLQEKRESVYFKKQALERNLPEASYVTLLISKTVASPCVFLLIQRGHTARRTIKLPSCCLRSLLRTITG